MAKTIGHTSSGKPVYAAFQLHPNFAGWTAVDHWDAADVHEAAKRVDVKTNVSMHENSSALHSEEAQQIVKAVEKLGLGRGAKPSPRRHSTMRDELIEPVRMPNGAPAEIHVSRLKGGRNERFTGWLVLSNGNRIPMALGFPVTLAEALRNAKRFLSSVYGRSN